MIDAATKKPLQVTSGPTMPSLDLSVIQLDEVRRLLDKNKIFYWVSENAISFDGGPEMTYIKFGREGNAAKVQALLDSVP